MSWSLIKAQKVSVRFLDCTVVHIDFFRPDPTLAADSTLDNEYQSLIHNEYQSLIHNEYQSLIHNEYQSLIHNEYQSLIHACI